MEEKIEGKIERIVDYIIGKPLSRITLDDYTILHEEIRDIRLRKSQAESGERLKQLANALTNADVRC